MNKTAIKNFAIWARRKLIADVTYKAGMLGITENGVAQPLPQSTRDMQFFYIGTKDYAEVSGIALEQRNALINVIQAREKTSDYKTAFRNVVEEVAYTWFNRLVAIRFMEINDYLPSRIRVLSSENEGKLEPDFVTNPFETDLEFSSFERDKVFQMKEENKLDDLFRMLFIKQCNKLSEILPGLFEQISDYTELLLNISFTDKDGIVYHLTHDISEDDFNVEKEGQVEIIGWMYQYYNTEPKDEVFALLKKNVKITKERIPAATQLFTPDWIVRYMVENSLGRLWVEGHPNESLKANWKYFLEEAEQEPDVVVQLNKIREEYAKLNPVDIKIIDPCMGSGHILVYAFEVLMQIYKSQGYVERDAAKSILENNLYGIDIDVRAYQLAYFAVMMKARQYNRKIFSENITPNLIAIRNPADISKSVLKRLGGLEPLGLRLVEDFQDAEEYGSILQVNYTEEELQRLEKRLAELEQEAIYGDMLAQTETIECVKLLKPLNKQARLLSIKYDVVVTNPPYMGSAGMSSKLAGFVKSVFPDSKTDLFAVFIEQCLHMTKQYGFQAMITQHTWMFISSFEKLRSKILNKDIINLLHLGARAFDEIGGEVVQTASFIISNREIYNYKGLYCGLTEANSELQKEEMFLSGNNRYVFQQSCFSQITGSPISYWISKQIIRAFSAPPLGEYYSARVGIQTNNNDLFLKYWYEVSYRNICLGTVNDEMSQKWYPHPKGGLFRKWYGNYDYVVNLQYGAKDMEAYSQKKYNLQPYFKNGLSWTHTTSGRFSCRRIYDNYVPNLESPVIYIEDTNKLLYVMAFLNSEVVNELLAVMNTGLHYHVANILSVPYLIERDEEIVNLTNKCIALSREDWDAFETSWDFKEHPFVRYSRGLWDITRTMANLSYFYGEAPNTYCSLEICWLQWQGECNERFNKLKIYEVELNRIFIDIYGLQDELTPDIVDKDVTVRKADLGRDIRSLISYAVGCMFGRFSLSVPGFAFASGEWDNTKYLSFIPDPDNCIPITDEEYFSDDIVCRFIEFIRVVYGKETLEENLDFVASALGNKGNTSREVIRNYFLNDFYKDHLKVYQKRPIYWLFYSGKQNGFKALVYMHRWNADTVGNLRIEYLHKMQNVYEHEIETCQDMIDHGSGRDVAVATKRKEKLVKQLKECKDYDALVAHIAFSKIDIDLDDGVKVNYRKVQTGADGKFCEILANSKDIMAKEK